MNSSPGIRRIQGKPRCAMSPPRDGVSPMHRQIAGKLTSPVTKWVVAVLALAAFLPMAYLGSKLTDVQDNEASSWLPASAESTKALDKLAPFQDENDIPTIVA